MDDYINKEVVEIDKVIEENKNGAMRRVTTETHHSGPDGSERRLYRMVAVSFGMLCVLQVALNISLRLEYCLSKGRDQQQKEKDFMEKFSNPCWNKFESCWYFLSTERKTWSESRKDCLERGADLVIINSGKEQRFLFALKKRVWIGLTDRETEGSWKWVDGTPLNTRYWGRNQPSSGGGQSTYQEKDCVELDDGQHQPEKTWNYSNCDNKLEWICELCNK
ncbi:CD209 antigen-like protein E isoform X2 [Salmo salar]|uniref:CD209 antigen-like protein E isoform X2 n=1 Tax=Salmo salar TaxID=8030 RepID=A0ABM3ERB7_SALSA|nr:CD209 antigen-like protein E isoform X2 [Salmo salar]